jgi:hypothetical protein
VRLPAAFRPAVSCGGFPIRCDARRPSVQRCGGDGNCGRAGADKAALRPTAGGSLPRPAFCCAACIASSARIRVRLTNVCGRRFEPRAIFEEKGRAFFNGYLHPAK